MNSPNKIDTENKSPLVSIVVPCYNHEKYIKECIISIIEQDYKNIELIVIDDGSNDASVDKINALIPLCEARFNRFIFRSRPNIGLSATLNEAISICNGEFMACIASDDTIISYKTRIQVNYLVSNLNISGVFGALERANSKTTPHYDSKISRYCFEDIFLHKYSLPAPSQLLRLSSIKLVGGYDNDSIIEDWSMWLSLTEKGGFLDHINIPMAYYRRHAGNTSSRVDLMRAGRMQIIEKYRDNHNYGAALSMVLLLSAIDVAEKSKLQSILFFMRAFLAHPFVIFRKKFLYFLSRLLGGPDLF